MEIKPIEIEIIKTDAGQCFITDCTATNGYDFDYHKTILDKLLFDGVSPVKTFHTHWYSIGKFPSKVEKVISGERENKRYELKNPELASDKLPNEIAIGDCDNYDSDIIGSLYSLKSDVKPDYSVEVDVKFNIICEVENFKKAPEFNYPAIKRVGFSDEKYSVTNQNIKHSLIDCIVTPEPVRSNSPCKISSKEMYDLVRQHIINNIDTKIARITSDYDFCFEVKKIIPLLKPHTYSYRDVFARTKKQREKLHFKTATYKEVSIYEMTHEQENYKNYTAIKSLSASNEWELKEMIDNYLSEVMQIIHSPLRICECCDGTGYLQNESN